MLHVQPNTTTTATISPDSPTDCIPKWSLEQDHHPGTMEQEDPVPPPPPPLTEDDEYFFLNQPPPPPPPIPPSMLLQEEENEHDQEEHHAAYDDDDDDDGMMAAMMDDKYETATRIFYATMQKFAGPSNHRRTFLESWHLHSMYSKSQQVLLGIPNAQSMVYLSGDDFMFTPQLVPQDTTAMMDQMEFDWEEEEEEEEENDDDDLPPIMMMTTTMMEQDASSPPLEENDDVMVMSAPAPVLDENLWMAPDKVSKEKEIMMMMTMSLTLVVYRMSVGSPWTQSTFIVMDHLHHHRLNWTPMKRVKKRYENNKRSPPPPPTWKKKNMTKEIFRNPVILLLPPHPIMGQSWQHHHHNNNETLYHNKMEPVMI